MLILLILNDNKVMSNDISMTDIPLNWRSLKKKGRSGNLMPTLRDIPAGKSVECASYGTARVYVSILNKEFPDREYNHYPSNGTYYIGRTA